MFDNVLVRAWMSILGDPYEVWQSKAIPVRIAPQTEHYNQ